MGCSPHSGRVLFCTLLTLTHKSSLITEHQLSLAGDSGKTLIPDEVELKKNQDANVNGHDTRSEQAIFR
jgi:hypothetical protein